MAEPLTPPPVEPDVVAAWNALVGAGRSFPAALAGRECTVQFAPPASAAEPVSAEVTGGGRRLWLSFADWSQWPAIAELLGDVNLAELPGEIAAAILSAAFAPALESLAHWVGGPCQVIAADPGLPTATNLVAVGLACRGADGFRADGTLRCEPSVLNDISRALAASSPAPSLSAASLPLSAGVEIGLTRIAPSELAAIRRHDVLLMDVAAPVDNRVGIVRFAPQAGWRVQIEADAVTLMSPIPPAAQRESSPELGVVVTFEQGSVTIAAEDVAGLAAEKSLPRTGDEIVVRCGGVTLGAGELVAIAGRQGVRLREWRVAAMGLG